MRKTVTWIVIKHLNHGAIEDVAEAVGSVLAV